jgi:hypothetical protein
VLSRELRQLQDNAVNAARLQQENELLKKKVQELLQFHKSPGETPYEGRIPLGELSPNKLAASQTAHLPNRQVSETVDYEKEYKRLHAMYADLEKSRDRYKSKLRQRIDQIDKWAQTSDKQELVIDRLRKRLALYESKGNVDKHADETGIGPLAHDQSLDIGVEELYRRSTNSSLGRSTNAAREPPQGITALVSADTTAEGSGNLTEDLLEATSVKNSPLGALELPNLSERGHGSAVAVKVELSSDGPVFVSERPAHKRKRGRDEPKIKQVQRIKSENSSSGPECTGEAHAFTPTEILDFDEDVHVPTPKKPRRLAKVQQSTREDDALRGRVTGAPSPSIFAPHAGAQTPLTPTTGPGATRILDHTPAQRETGAHTSAAVSFGEKKPQSHRALQLHQGIRDLAEDGDAEVTTVQRRVARGRLDALLNSPSVRTSSLKIQPVSHKVQNFQTPPEDDNEAALQVPARRELPHGKRLPPKETSVTPVRQKAAGGLLIKPNLSRERARKRPSILRDDMLRGPPPDKEDVHLRQRPRDALRPEDFKPNPSYNDGLTYVYDEVVRGREARSALSGCTDLNCCGKTFRSFAKAERSTIGPSVTTRAEDIKLLEEYLGDDAYKLGSMTRDEKEETWLLAKTWELASKFGRHRQRYSRMPSPPGYWSVEFPSTQERAEERRQAGEIQKALVKERYREAMRPGGRWLFRDEEGH